MRKIVAAWGLGRTGGGPSALAGWWRLNAALLLLALSPWSLAAQQVPDRGFAPEISRPAFAVGAGPRLCLDEAHHNFHTLDNRFFAFGALARRDGFRVGPLREVFTADALAACEILVISNAQPSDAAWETYSYPTPSAFSVAEVVAVRRWVEGGGRLLLIADHMPLAGAATLLAAAFGATFTDGFAFEGERGPDGAWRRSDSDAPTMFVTRDGARTDGSGVDDTVTAHSAAPGMLSKHPIARGRDSTERVTQVRSFTGQAFRMKGDGVQPVLVLPEHYVSLEPRIAWRFEPSTPLRHVGGWLQGATRHVGSGRVALFGEAAMFSAQIAGEQRVPMGMNAPGAEQNPQFVLNVLRWLTGVIEP